MQRVRQEQRVRVVPVVLVPRDVVVVEELGSAQQGMGKTELDQAGVVPEILLPLRLQGAPVKVVELVVVPVGVVVPLARVPVLVTHEHHRRALAHHQREVHVTHLPPPQRRHRLVVALPVNVEQNTTSVNL